MYPIWCLFLRLIFISIFTKRCQSNTFFTKIGLCYSFCVSIFVYYCFFQKPFLSTCLFISLCWIILYFTLATCPLLHNSLSALFFLNASFFFVSLLIVLILNRLQIDVTYPHEACNDKNPQAGEQSVRKRTDQTL